MDLYMVVAYSFLLRILGECSAVHSLLALLLLLLLLFFSEVEIRLHTLILLFMPGSVHSGSASWYDCGRMYPDKLHVSKGSCDIPRHVCWYVASCLSL